MSPASGDLPTLQLLATPENRFLVVSIQLMSPASGD